MLYGRSAVTGTGMSWRRAKSRRALRESKFHSRHGAMTRSWGASAAYVSSKRTWSFPLPVAPWATASAPSLSATSTWARAISGRAIDVPSR